MYEQIIVSIYIYIYIERERERSLQLVWVGFENNKKYIDHRKLFDIIIISFILS